MESRRSIIPLPSTTYSVRSIKSISKPTSTVLKNISTTTNILSKSVEDITLTGNPDVDTLILESLDSVTLNNLDVNSYTRKILSNPEFWKKRVNKRLGLTSTRPNIDYEYISKSLDNGLSLEENYIKIVDRLKNFSPYKLNQVWQIIDDNKVIKPKELLDKIVLTIPEFFEYRNLPYDEFIDNIIIKNNSLSGSPKKMTRDYMDEYVYSGKNLTIIVPVKDNTEIIIHLYSNNGWTNGLILYELVQKLPGDLNDLEELHDIYGEYHYFREMNLKDGNYVLRLSS